MSTWSKVLLEDANITVGTITPTLTDITTALSASNHDSVELVVLDNNELKTVTADFNTGAFNPTTVNTNTMGSGFTVSATTDTTATTITQGEDLFFAAGTGIACETTSDGTVTITNTVSNTNTMGSGFTVAATTVGTGTTITESDSLTLAAGAGISTTGTSDGVVTIANTITNNNQLTNGEGFTTLALGTSSSQALAGNTAVDVVSSTNLLNGLALLDDSGDIVIGDATDTTVVIAGNLTVNGTTTTINSTTITVDDKNIVLASGAADAAGLSGAGISIDATTNSVAGYAADPEIKWNSTHPAFSQWEMVKGVTGETSAFIAGMTTGTDFANLNSKTPGVGTFGMVGGALYIQTA